MRGILNVNKPSGPSSYDIIRTLKPRLHPKKIGHTGTLDPLASGVLLILLNEATKIAPLLLHHPKEYEAEIRFGIQTDTDDITGKVIGTAPLPDIDPAQVTEILNARFLGEIEQVPPRFSALKTAGQPLYRLARQGIDITPPVRRITIYQLHLLEWQPPLARLRCLVSSGTFIRAICRDIGLALGSCATLNALTRTKIGKFTIEQAWQLPQLTDPAAPWEKIIIPIETALDHLPAQPVTPAQSRTLLQGKAVTLDPNADNEQKQLLAFTPDRRFLALVQKKERQLVPERIIYAD